MKKLSVLIALALVLTIGGAYATWTYAEGTVGAQNLNNIGITMEAADVDTAAGAYSFGENTLKFSVDGGSTNTSELLSDGSLVITFTAPNNSPYYTTPIATTVTVTVTAGDNYGDGEGTPLLTEKTEHTIPVTWGAGNNGVFTATINASAIADCVTLAAINLPTKADYDNYAELLVDYKINLSVAPTT